MFQSTCSMFGSGVTAPSVLLFLLNMISNLSILVNAEQPSILIIIRSQPNSFHVKRAADLQSNLDSQIDTGSLKNIKIIQVHMQWKDSIDKAWGILPIIPDIHKSFGSKYKWVMFVEETTSINIEKLVKYLSNQDSKKEVVLARGLFDPEITIIHHFDQSRSKNGGPFLSPDFDSGWVLSISLVTKITKELSKTENSKPDFQIDLKYEFAKFLSKLGIEITNTPEFCGAGEENVKCITNVKKEFPECGDEIGIDDIFVAVKTTMMFHKDRLKVVKDTWGPKWKHIVMYSNVTDPNIPTIDCGVPNTIRGHCGKTEMIMKDFLERSKMRKYKWLVIADDDTIMSVSRMIKLLNCYDPDEELFLGEKYGYSVNSGYGYGYITGGGGMVFSKSAVEAFEENCACPTNNTPDDMFLGQCLSSRCNIPCTHSGLFHQARPADYAVGYLGNQVPISFHKHWMVDPIQVYKTWFAEADSEMETYDHSVQEPAATTLAPDIMPSPLPPTPTENQMKDEL